MNTIFCEWQCPHITAAKSTEYIYYIVAAVYCSETAKNCKTLLNLPKGGKNEKTRNLLVIVKKEKRIYVQGFSIVQLCYISYYITFQYIVNPFVCY